MSGMSGMFPVSVSIACVLCLLSLISPSADFCHWHDWHLTTSEVMMLTNIIRDSYKIKHGLNERVHYLITQLYNNFYPAKRRVIMCFDLSSGDTEVWCWHYSSASLAAGVSVWGRGSVMSACNHLVTCYCCCDNAPCASLCNYRLVTSHHQPGLLHQNSK